MRLINRTELPAALAYGLRPDGTELLAVVVKGTFTLAEHPHLLPITQQVPICTVDQFDGEPLTTPPRYETDLVPFKPRCDVLLHGTAYAPADQLAERMLVGLRIGDLDKQLLVSGRRHWRRRLLSYTASEPEPFTTMPLSYALAFGGADHSHPDPEKHEQCQENPLGIGFHAKSPSAIADSPLPCIEDPTALMTSPRQRCQPVGFAPLFRGWMPRRALAGTYDEHWQEEVAPFLPVDFDEAYYQCAPHDQQLPYLRGGEPIILDHLTPAGHTTASVPTHEVPVRVFFRDGSDDEVAAVMDTLIIEPDQQRMIVTWRATVVVRGGLASISEIVAGAMSRGWYRARKLGKSWYASTDDAIAARRLRAGPAGAGVLPPRAPTVVSP